MNKNQCSDPGPVMIDLTGLELDAEERELLQHPATGGVILFSRNFSSPEQLYRLTTSIHEIRKSRLLIAVDQEGGRVQRCREGFSRLPAARYYGRIYDDNREAGEELARSGGWLMASELQACGVGFSFAPVLDLDRGVSSVIGDRAFSSQADAVGHLARAWISGARSAGMSSVGKHFPGHGAVVADSHLELPVDTRPLAEIELSDLRPFAQLAETLAGIMPAHVLYPEVDAQPAGFSRFWIERILRQRLRFDGAVFSDDLSMAGAHVAGTAVDRAHAALAAGCDMLLVCNNRPDVVAVLEAELPKRGQRSAARLKHFRVDHIPQRETADPLAELRSTGQWRSAVAALSGALEDCD